VVQDFQLLLAAHIHFAQVADLDQWLHDDSCNGCGECRIERPRPKCGSSPVDVTVVTHYPT
jgi:hypothetical protein